MRTIIAGPCVIEHSAQWLVDQAGRVIEQVSSLPGASLIFKASFDKANRSTLDGRRGLGIQEGLAALADVRKIYGIRVTTDVHEPWQAYEVAQAGVIPQVPAMLARQTDLIRSCALSGAPQLNIKVPVWADHEEASALLAKASQAAFAGVEIPPYLSLIYRGTQYGPGKRNLRIDWPLLSSMAYAETVLLDVTHTNHGDFAETLTAGLRALRVDYLDGIFAETHSAPAEAWCDGKHQLSPSQFRVLLDAIAPKFFGGQAE